MNEGNLSETGIPVVLSDSALVRQIRINLSLEPQSLVLDLVSRTLLFRFMNGIRSRLYWFVH